MSFEIQDLTPLTLAELESFCFRTLRVNFEDLDQGLRYALEETLGRAVVSRDPGAIHQALEHFNAYEIRDHVQSCYCSQARACVKVKCYYPVDLDLWVEYTGVADEYVDTLPKRLKHEVMDKYLNGWRDLVKDPQQDQYLTNVMKNALMKHLAGRHFNRSRIEGDAYMAIMATGIVDSAKVKYHEDQYHNRKLVMEVQFTGRVLPTQFTADIT